MSQCETGVQGDLLKNVYQFAHLLRKPYYNMCRNSNCSRFNEMSASAGSAPKANKKPPQQSKKLVSVL